MLRIGSNKDAIVLDFFAGSGTTGEAVMRLNAEDGGNRKFILVQIDEKIKRDRKDAFEFCEKNGLEPVISSITLERLNRAGDIIQKEHPDVDVGYKVFSLKSKPKVTSDESQTVFSAPHTGRSTYDVLFNMLCATHKPFDTPIKELKKDLLYEIDGEMYVLGEVDLSDYKEFPINVDGWGETNTLEMYLNIPQLKTVKIVY